MVGKQGEVPSFKVIAEVLHPEYGGLHLQQERGVVLFMNGQFSACISYDAMLPILSYLGEDSSQPALVAIITERSISEQCVGSV